MKATLRTPGALAVILFATACADEAAQPPAHAAPPRAAAPRLAEPAVAPAPAVTSLLEDDPELTATISPEEVKATLESARGGSAPVAPSSEPADASTTGGSEWQRLEQEQKQKLADHRRKLEATTVQAGPDGAYHASGCEVLYTWIMQPDKTVRRIYMGRPVTLAHALDSGMGRHGACGPPTGDLQY